METLGSEMNCPNCHADEPAPARRDRRLVECRRCGLLRLRPRLSPAEAMAEMRERYSRPGRFASSNPIHEASRYQDEVRLINSFVSRRSESPSALDVGAGYGGLVRCLALNGFDAVGLDPFPGFVELAVRHGIDVRRGRFERAGLPPGLLERRFDLISFRGSICYLSDLREGFELVRELLKPGGCVYVQMHVLDSLYYRGGRDVLSRYGPFVSFVPTRASLRRLLQEHGLQVELERGVVGSGAELLLGRRPRWIGAAIDEALNPLIAAAGRHDAVMYVARP